MKILVTGGAGYIGSFMIKRLLEQGDEVVVADSLERGHKEVVDQRAKLMVGNLLDKSFVQEVFRDRFHAVIHFAGFISMGESMENPYLYFQNNVFSSLNILEQMSQTGANNFIFSSSAGVYGNPEQIPIPESSVTAPTNPYGESKLMVEKLMGWYGKTKKLNTVALRYFNAAGASLDGLMGEEHLPESHIIPKIIEALLENKPFNLFGNDYKTKDGTCVRDYIHVLDLVEAHILAINKIRTMPGNYVYNVGTGAGFSNKEIIGMVEKVSGQKVNIQNSPRRPGDADELIADPTKIKSELGFSPKYSDRETIIKTAWQWHSKK
ncbi:MAG TPA: UDP-glucose 4-epimerase GalE [Patescibacteria group bacterium]|jgi:UDP-glucose 4-epimerase|nr:UDP-glucose 4-epimerase GalE [Patescibacteria group bacterium]